jgi:hypothetical protein
MPMAWLLRCGIGKGTLSCWTITTRQITAVNVTSSESGLLSDQANA